MLPDFLTEQWRVWGSQHCWNCRTFGLYCLCWGHFLYFVQIEQFYSLCDVSKMSLNVKFVPFNDNMHEDKGIIHFCNPHELFSLSFRTVAVFVRYHLLNWPWSRLHFHQPHKTWCEMLLLV